MADLLNLDLNSEEKISNNIFGLPFTEEGARLIILPVPWEVTVSCGSGTARSPEHIFKASMDVDPFDPDVPNSPEKGFFMREPERKLLTKSDYLRKEAELYINFTSQGRDINQNRFMNKSLKEINAGNNMMNAWVYEQTKELLNQDKLVALLGGDHSTPLGFYKALGEKYSSFGILQIDAHCDLKKSDEDFLYSYASVMYNALEEVKQIEKLVQAGIRDYSEQEWNYVRDSNNRVVTYFDYAIKERLMEGETWKNIAEEIVNQLPQQVYISFDVAGLDPKLCPHTGAPVFGGFQAEQVIYLFKKVIDSGRKLIGFDLVETGVGEGNYDAKVSAKLLWKMCNFLMQSNN